MQLRFDILIRERVTDDTDYAGMIAEIEHIFRVPVYETVKPRQDFAALLKGDAPGETLIKLWDCLTFTIPGELRLNKEQQRFLKRARYDVVIDMEQEE